MTVCRLPLVCLALLGGALANVPAGAQPSAPDAGAPAIAEPAPQAAPEPAPDTRPRSPEEEAKQRSDKLDALFAKLAAKDDPDWESVQNDIWRLWSESGSPSMDLLLSRAEKALQGKDYELALKFLNDLTRLDPTFAEGWNKRATVYFMMGDFGRSVADIQHTLALEPRHFGALAGLGMILERLGDKKGALMAYRKGLEINPNMSGVAESAKRLAPEVDGREL